MAVAEATDYCEEDLNANFKIESLGKFFAFEIIDKIESGTEIFSKRRESELDSIAYLEKFYPETVINRG